MQRDFKTVGYNDYICNGEITYVICHFQSNVVSYQLRGYHLFKPDFIVEHQEKRCIEDVVFQSMWDDCQIRKENQTWVIRKGHQNVPIAFQKFDRLPLGITEWTISETNQTQLLELTKVCIHYCMYKSMIHLKTFSSIQCTMDEFTCDNGDCIDMEGRCNKQVDCDDKSDEIFCNLLKLDENSFLTLHPPMQDEKLDIEISIDLLSIFNIDEINMKFHSKLRLTMKWRDSRLTFVNLMEKGNILSLDNIASIWIPILEFENSEDSDENSLNTQSGQNQVVSIQKEGKGTYPDVTYVNDGFRYLGSENSLVLKALHIKDFQCKFNFITYPFDTQDCYIQLKVPERYKDHLSLIAGSVNYSVDMSMAQYILRNVYLAVNETGLITCHFQLKRSVGIYHIHSTFLPTFFILIMSLMSLFVKENHFEATIMVSLTCMLVLYTLFQSIMAGMPITQYINMMAIWLIFNLMVPFIVFITIVCWELMMKEEKHPKEMNGRSPKDKCKITMQIVLPLVSCTFIFYYACFAIFFHMT